MPLRLSLRPLARQLQALAPQASRASISTTSKKAATSHLGSNSATRDLLNFEDETTTATQPFDRAATPSPNNPGATAGLTLQRVMRRTDALSRISENKEQLQDRKKEQTQRTDLARQMPRAWRDGDVYAPHDLSEAEMRKWRTPKRPTKDILDVLGLNPLDHYKNFSIISEFMTDMGRIKPSSETGLRPVNQRRMAKAIRRAIGMGIHPSTHKHPELLFGQTQSGPRAQKPLRESASRTKFKLA